MEPVFPHQIQEATDCQHPEVPDAGWAIENTVWSVRSQRPFVMPFTVIPPNDLLSTS